MNQLLGENSRVVENTTVIKEEKRGFAMELMQNNTRVLTEAVRKEIQKLSVLEVIT